MPNLNSVTDLFIQNNLTWRIYLISICFHPTDVAFILSIPLLFTTTEDMLIWDGASDGIYTVKTGGQLLRTPPSLLGTPHQNWQKY